MPKSDSLILVKFRNRLPLSMQMLVSKLVSAPFFKQGFYRHILFRFFLLASLLIATNAVLRKKKTFSSELDIVAKNQTNKRLECL
jgi:hypothetical protein